MHKFILFLYFKFRNVVHCGPFAWILCVQIDKLRVYGEKLQSLSIENEEFETAHSVKKESVAKYQ